MGFKFRKFNDIVTVVIDNVKLLYFLSKGTHDVQHNGFLVVGNFVEKSQQFHLLRSEIVQIHIVEKCRHRNVKGTANVFNRTA